ncbi:hypothetical protein B0T19DRAFT_157970 [Cercophora scortea]|uniref:Uncharacterized protein n=1 Tax=Cercophora scortea TaxID=314031 RepID=A0AAE0ILS8_9PEZI|nr:hypothetical protein B0T19DRAFT_157970 [Cercophora scortea]
MGKGGKQGGQNIKGDRLWPVWACSGDQGQNKLWWTMGETIFGRRAITSSPRCALSQKPRPCMGTKQNARSGDNTQHHHLSKAVGFWYGCPVGRALTDRQDSQGRLRHTSTTARPYFDSAARECEALSPSSLSARVQSTCTTNACAGEGRNNGFLFFFSCQTSLLRHYTTGYTTPGCTSQPLRERLNQTFWCLMLLFPSSLALFGSARGWSRKYRKCIPALAHCAASSPKAIASSSPVISPTPHLIPTSVDHRTSAISSHHSLALAGWQFDGWRRRWIRKGRTVQVGPFSNCLYHALDMAWNRARFGLVLLDFLISFFFSRFLAGASGAGSD